MSETILVKDHGNWVQLTLNRPDKLNSFNAEMHLCLRGALEKVRDEKKRAVLITGNGRGFCAGQDLEDRDPKKMEQKPDLGATIANYYNPLVRLIRQIEAPVICAVNGVAAGAGANIAFACDLVLASDKAKFIQSFAKVGLVPDAGGTWSLTHLLGEARAKALAFTAMPLSAQQAVEWGLIYKAVPDDALLSEAQALAAQMAQGPTIGFAHIKKAIHAARTNSFDDHLELEARYQKICGATEDYAEGVSAFLEKRAPQFKGQA